MHAAISQNVRRLHLWADALFELAAKHERRHSDGLIPATSATRTSRRNSVKIYLHRRHIKALSSSLAYKIATVKAREPATRDLDD